MSCFPHPWASTGWSYAGALFALALSACGGTTGDVLSLPGPGAPLGAPPAGCRDHHQEGDACYQEELWLESAARGCEAAGQVLGGAAPLGGCGPGYQRGLYYRCCQGMPGG